MKTDLERFAGVALELASAHRLTGLGPAQIQCSLARRFPAIHMIKGQHAVHLGARQVEHLGQYADGLFRHVTELVLHRMQNGQQRSGLVHERLGDGTHCLLCLQVLAHGKKP